MSDSWKEPQFAKEYMDGANNMSLNWYEHFVNAASLWSLILKETNTVLDFGCGPGEFTAQLKEKGYAVSGCDGSEAMVELAEAHYSDIDFFVWDGTSPISDDKRYDAIVTKLTLHFVDDLAVLARNFAPALQPNGSLIISVPHPMSTMPKANGEYFEQVPYDTEIGSYGMYVTMIHRSVQDYINPFLNNGYVMTAIVEPIIPDDIIKKYNVAEGYAAIPRRLNLRFKRA
ncbi:MAG TPA: class I SAM-dependent methyltransferase [Candidatus Saccharimonadales bacterium]|nr:class I SAM-dependent methyltransferase [Candidatus Saccharimonadales bacterium]